MLGERVRDFLESTSAHGLPKTTSKSKKEKFFWIFVCLGVYATVFFVTGEIVYEYFRRAKGTHVYVFVCGCKKKEGKIKKRRERCDKKKKKLQRFYALLSF